MTCHCSRLVHRAPASGAAAGPRACRARRREATPRRRAARSGVHSAVRSREQAKPQQVERRDHRELTHLVAVAGQAQMRRLGTSPSMQSPTNSVPTGWPSCSVGPATPVRASPTSAPSTRARAVGHRDRRLLAHDRPVRHAEHVELHLAGVATRPSPRSTSLAPGTPVSRAATRPPVTDSASAEREPALRAAGRARPISIVSSSTPNTSGAEEVADLGLPPRRAARRGLGSVVGLGREPHLEPLQPLARKASVGLPDVVEPLDHVGAGARRARTRSRPTCASVRLTITAVLARPRAAGRAARPARASPSSRGARRARRRRPCRRPGRSARARCPASAG